MGMVRGSSSALLGVTVLLLVSACSGPFSSATAQSLEGVVIDPPQEKPSFTLTDTEGERFDFGAATEGKLALLYFGYTHCPDICPVHLAQIAESLNELPDVDPVVVFVTVDPERDTPGYLRDYLDNFDHRFVGLTGTSKELATAQEAAGVAVAFRTGEGADYTMAHAGQVLAYAPDGLGHSEYPFGTRQTTWINDLAVLAGMGATGSR